jgi:hypothetical protein
VAKFTLTDASITINSVDLSAHAFSIDINLEKDKIDVSGFSSTSATEYLPGKKEEEFTVQFRQDFAAAKVDATLWPLYNNGTTFPFVIKPTSAAVSATNPSYSGNANLYEYHPLDGDLGDASETSVTFQITGGIARATS